MGWETSERDRMKRPQGWAALAVVGFILGLCWFTLKDYLKRSFRRIWEW